MSIKRVMDRNILATSLLIIFICTLFLGASICINQRAADSCFHMLDDAAAQAVSSIQSCISSNWEQLDVIADLLAQHDSMDSDIVQRHLSAFRQRGTIAAVGLLLPSGRLLLPGGDGSVPEDAFVFSEEQARAPYVSDALDVPGSDGKRLFYQAVPVVRDGQTLGVLYGFIDLDSFADSLRVTAYDGNVQFCIADGETGDFLVDTWHHTLGNIYDDSMMSRRVKRGYDFSQMKRDFDEGRAGRIAFWSNTAGEYLYSCYLPVGVNRWMVQLTALESVVFENLVFIRRMLLFVAGAEVLAFAAYFLWVLSRVRKDTEQKSLRLAQSMYMYDVQQTLFDAYKAPELFAAALQKVATMLIAQRAFFLVLEKGAIRESFFSAQDGGRALDLEGQTLPLASALERLCAGESILLYAQDEPDAQTRDELARLRIASLMLTPVLSSDGALAGVLGCVNMKRRWQDCVLLECVSRNFLIAQSNMEFHRRIRQLSMTDALTGLGNRHSFEQLTDSLESKPPEALCCLYIDANGLHELNNVHGHAAGDAMLQSIGGALSAQFRTECCFRIGGDEFVVLCGGLGREETFRRVCLARARVEEAGYRVSIGAAWLDEAEGVQGMVSSAEKRMYEDKRAYYRHSGKRPRVRLDDGEDAQV